MKLTLQKKIGDAMLTIEIDEKTERDALARASFYLEPNVCLMKGMDNKACGNTGIVWSSNRAKTDDGVFTYIKRFCPRCLATSTAGEYKGGGLFWKKWEIYKNTHVQENDFGL